MGPLLQPLSLPVYGTIGRILNPPIPILPLVLDALHTIVVEEHTHVNMSARSTRRRSPRNRDVQSSSDDEQPKTNGVVAMNGNGSAHADPVASSADDKDEERENIFLFWPNLIGAYPAPAFAALPLWSSITC